MCGSLERSRHGMSCQPVPPHLPPRFQPQSEAIRRAVNSLTVSVQNTDRSKCKLVTKIQFLRDLGVSAVDHVVVD